MRRVLALVAATAMVAGSVALRSRMDRRADDVAAPRRLVCAAELGPVCDALRRTSADVSVEPALSTTDRLARSTADDPGVDAWLVPAPWPQIVDIRRRGQAPLFPDVGAPLARSPLVLVVEKVLATRCGAAIAAAWKCLGEAAGARQAKPGHASDAVGALVLGQATAGYFGRVDDLSTTDLDDPAFARWLRGLELAVPPSLSGASPLEDMLGTRFATYDAVGTIEAEAAPLVAAAAVRDRVTLLYPSPMATADVVLATAGKADTKGLREAAKKALAESGWRVDGVSRPGEPPLPPTNGLPSPGFLDALRAMAVEVRR